MLPFAAHHHRDDARRVGLERQHLQVEHQVDVVGVEHRDARRLVDRRREAGHVLLGALDALLDLADRRQIFVELALVGRTEVGGRARPCARRRDRGCCGDSAAGAPAPRAEGWYRCRRTAARIPGAGSFPAASASPDRATRGCSCRRTNSPSRSCRPCASRRSRSRASRSASASRSAAPQPGRRKCRSGCRRRPSSAGARRSGTTAPARAWSPGPSPSA